MTDITAIPVTVLTVLLEGDRQRPRKAKEARTSRLVFIGRDLPEEFLQNGLALCQTLD
jgi:Cobalamin synthesis protein cobW C-terminal domain